MEILMKNKIIQIFCIVLAFSSSTLFAQNIGSQAPSQEIGWSNGPDLSRVDNGTMRIANETGTAGSGKLQIGELQIWDGAAYTAIDFDTVGGGAPTDATYITSTANGSLSNGFALGSLATGLLKNTISTGIPTIAIAGTDYLAPSAINDTAFNESTWNANNDAPTKNVVRDYLETLAPSGVVDRTHGGTGTTISAAGSTFMGTPSGTNFAAWITGESGTGNPLMTFGGHSTNQILDSPFIADTITINDIPASVNGTFLLASGSLTYLYDGSPSFVATTAGITVPDNAYNATSWNGNFTVPTKNAVRDQIELATAALLSPDEISSSSELAALVGDTLGTGKFILSNGALAVATGKTLTASNSLTFVGTDGSTLVIGTGGTLGTAAYTPASDYSPQAYATYTSTSAVTTETSGADHGAKLVAAFSGSSASNLIVSSPGTADIGSLGPLSILGGHTFIGNGVTISHTGGGANPVISASNVSDWTIQNVKLSGLGTGAEYGLKTALTVRAALIDNVVSSGFGAVSGVGTGSAFYFNHTTSGSPYTSIRINNVIGKNSSSGATFIDLAEYATVTNSKFYSNYIGILDFAGNTTFNAVNSNANSTYGLSVFASTNDGHGSFTGGTLNHNGTGCAFFQGITHGYVLGTTYMYADNGIAITLDACQGVLIEHCGISGPILLTDTHGSLNPGVNSLRGCDFKTSEKTYVESASQAEYDKLIITNNLMKDGAGAGGGEFWLDRLQVNDPLTQTSGLVAAWMSNHGACFRSASTGNGNRGQNLSSVDGSHAVAALRDRSWNNKTFTVWNNTNYPDYETGDLNGVPSVKFTRANSDMLEMAQPASTSSSGTIVLVVMPQSDTGNQTILAQCSSTVSGSFFSVYREDADDKLHVQFNTTRDFKCDTTLLTTNVAHVIVISSNGSTHTVRIDGVDQTLTYSSGVNDGTWFASLTTDDCFTLSGYHYNSTTADFADMCLGLCFIYDTVNYTDNPESIKAIERRAAEEFKVSALY
jgi:hypothetical protein